MMSDDNALIQALLSQIMPEWSISKQAYQPTDIANQTSQTNILQDQFQLMANPLLQILNGTFDYSLLDDVQGETVAPETPMLNSYLGNEKYAAVIQGLQNGESPDEAARGAWALATGKEGDAVWDTTAENDPALANYLEVAKSLQPDVAAVRQYQATGGNGMVKSDMAKQLEEMGLSSEQTPDSYFSDSIDQQLIDEERTITDTDKIIDDYLAERRKFSKGATNPHLAGLGQERAASEGYIQDPLPKPQPVNDGTVEGYVESQRFGPSIAEVSSAISDPWLKQMRNSTAIKPWADLFTGGGDDEPDKPQEFAFNGDPGHDAVMQALRERQDEKLGTTTAGGQQDSDVPVQRGKYFGGGDPRDPRSQTAKAMRWDEEKAKRGDRSSSEDIMKYVNAKQGRVHGNSSAIERGLIDRERSSGRTMQRDALTRMLLSMPR
jgi:hypothetical protein